MALSGKPILYDWRSQIPRWKKMAENWIIHNRWKLIAGALLLLIVWQKDLTLQLDMSRHGRLPATSASTGMPPTNPERAASLIWAETEDAPAEPEVSAKPKPTATPARKTPQPTRSARPVSAKDRERMAYIDRFAGVARTEMRKYGIPASITLAQGLLESSAGKSRLSRDNNNHFGIKCHSRSCSRGHCSNFSDDSHKDFFRIFETAWESYRAHSLVLQRDRYQFLFDLAPSDYKGWAHGLQKAGYATDPKYGDKLISLIERLELYRYDR